MSFSTPKRFSLDFVVIMSHTPTIFVQIHSSFQSQSCLSKMLQTFLTMREHEAKQHDCWHIVLSKHQPRLLSNKSNAIAAILLQGNLLGLVPYAQLLHLLRNKWNSGQRSSWRCIKCRPCIEGTSAIGQCIGIFSFVLKYVVTIFEIQQIPMMQELHGW